MALSASYAEIIVRELNKLKKEVSDYQDDSNLWRKQGSISNSAGHLVLHLVGNLQHFIGAILGNTGYQRNRELEFNSEAVPRTRLLESIDATIRIVETTLAALEDQALEQPYSHAVRPEPVTTQQWLLHLVSHLSYHIGQVNYHRRLIDGTHRN